jgi:ribosomal protein S18 acetylase RimI-like enzyme
MKINKRIATEADKEFLYSLNKTVYLKLVERTIGKWDENFQRDYFEQKWKKSGYQIIEKDNKKIGVIWIEHETGQNVLREIQLLPEYQNQGIGTNLIEEEIKRAQKLVLPLRLRLLKGNNSLSLYKRLGFRVYEESEDYLYMEINV